MTISSVGTPQFGAYALVPEARLSQKQEKTPYMTYAPYVFDQKNIEISDPVLEKNVRSLLDGDVILLNTQNTFLNLGYDPTIGDMVDRMRHNLDFQEGGIDELTDGIDKQLAKQLKSPEVRPMLEQHIDSFRRLAPIEKLGQMLFGDYGQHLTDDLLLSGFYKSLSFPPQIVPNEDGDDFFSDVPMVTQRKKKRPRS